MARKKTPILKRYALIYNFDHPLLDGNWFWNYKPDIPSKTYEEEKYLSGMKNLYDFDEYCGTAIVEATNMLEAKIKALKWILEKRKPMGYVYENLTDDDLIYLGFKNFMLFHEEDEPQEKIDEFKDFFNDIELNKIEEIISIYQLNLNEHNSTVNDDCRIKIISLLKLLSIEMQDFFHSWLFINHIELFYLDLDIK